MNHQAVYSPYLAGHNGRTEVSMRTTNRTTMITHKIAAAYAAISVFVFLLPCMPSEFLGFQALAAETTHASASAAKAVELGFVKRIFQEVGGNQFRWLDRFCEVALAQKGEDYARFVRLVRLETTPLTNDDYRYRPEGIGAGFSAVAEIEGIGGDVIHERHSVEGRGFRHQREIELTARHLARGVPAVIDAGLDIFVKAQKASRFGQPMAGSS